MQETLFSVPAKLLTTSYIQGLSINENRGIVFTDGQFVYKCSDENESEKLFPCSSYCLQVIRAADGYWLSDAEGCIMKCNEQGKILKKFDFKSEGKAVFKLIRTDDGNLWACQDANEKVIRITPSEEVRFYGKDKGLTSRLISLGLSSKGTVYGGGMHDTAYFFRFDNSLDRFVNLSKPLKFERNIDLNVNDIACLGESEVWLATSFGLACYQDGKIERKDLQQITANSIKAIAIDKQGYVWFANNKGLHRYRNGDLMSFDTKNGLPDKAIGYRCLLTDSDGKIWVGTFAGMAVSPVLSQPSKTQKPILRSVLINNELIDLQKSGTLEANNRGVFSIRISSLEFPTKNIQFESRILETDSIWRIVVNDGFIILSGFKPGKYHLEVRARQAGNFINSDPLICEFEITRIWYERWYVIGLGILIILVLLRAIILLNSSRLRKDNLRLENSVQERTQEITIQKAFIEKQNEHIVQKNEALSLKNRELEQAKENAEEANRAKSQFLSIMSHEIRTPMNAVIGITHLLMRNNPRPEQFEDLKILKFSAENLLSLINDVLDLNKIEAGKLALEEVEFNLLNLVEGIASSLQYKSEEKGNTLKVNCDEVISQFVKSDPMRLTQILNNLVGNAIKFTAQGSIEVRVKLLEQLTNEQLVEFSVTDTGVGIPEEMQDKIFDSFTQASSETSRKYGGTGLGLAISDRLAELMGSTIKVESEQGKGSRFYFRILLREGSGATAVNELIEATEAFNKEKVLLVEDNRINEIIARKLMEEWNLTVDSANSGSEAVRKAKLTQYNLILMDLQMPEMDGYQTTMLIRKLGDEYSNIPIIALTASSKTDIQEKVIIAGMNDFVLKPFNPQELHIRLKQYLS
ncbi:MAG: response regulator [Bacteroidales bacterium]|nr:response regulator [Bacteroidales bacterium]